MKPLSEKVTNLEIKQAVVEVSLCDVKSDLDAFIQDTKKNFYGIRKLIFKSMIAIIGLLLTIIGFFVNMYFNIR